MKKIYRTCEDLPVFNFYKVVETKDYSYLYVDFDGYSKVEIDEEIEEIWLKLYEEYIQLTGDNSTILYYELVKELLYLETRYKIVSTLLGQLSMGRMNENTFKAYVLELSNWQYNLNTEKSLQDEIVRLSRQLRQSENKIRIKQEEKKKFEEKEGGDKLSLIEQQVKLEQALTRNEIDTKKTSVAKWITLIKEVKSINKERRKKNGK